MQAIGSLLALAAFGVHRFMNAAEVACQSAIALPLSGNRHLETEHSPFQNLLTANMLPPCEVPTRDYRQILNYTY